jgi:hypothetical protein
MKMLSTWCWGEGWGLGTQYRWLISVWAWASSPFYRAQCTLGSGPFPITAGRALWEVEKEKTVKPIVFTECLWCTRGTLDLHSHCVSHMLQIRKLRLREVAICSARSYNTIVEAGFRLILKLQRLLWFIQIQLTCGVRFVSILFNPLKSPREISVVSWVLLVRNPGVPWGKSLILRPHLVNNRVGRG